MHVKLQNLNIQRQLYLTTKAHFFVNVMYIVDKIDILSRFISLPTRTRDGDPLCHLTKPVETSTTGYKEPKKLFPSQLKNVEPTNSEKQYIEKQNITGDNNSFHILTTFDDTLSISIVD